MKIQTVIDDKRGCGWRQERGLYLVSGGIASPCGKLPIRLEVCRCCGQGIKPARGWTWIDPFPITADVECKKRKGEDCSTCPFEVEEGGTRVGLIWVGEKFYRTPVEFNREVAAQGVSRRISQVPRGFKVGETWVYLGHKNGMEVVEDGDRKFKPAIFSAFRPTRIEYIVNGKEKKKELESLVKRGVTPVKVKRRDEQLSL